MKKIVKQPAVILLVILALMAAIHACKKEKIDTPETPLQVDSYYPNSGKGGTLVTIEGKGFNTNADQTTVNFNGIVAKLVSVKAEKIVVQSPINGSTGTITLTSENSTMEIGNYTYQELSVRQVFPTNGPAGSNIRISGEGFSGAEGPAKVTFNQKEATIVSANDTLLIAAVPADAGSGTVAVQVDGNASEGQVFTFQAIREIKPLTGGKGTRVTLIGEGFESLASENVVEFNGKQAIVEEAEEGKLVVVAPEKVETGPMSVTIKGQKTTGPAFTVVSPPTISTVSPLSGPVGSLMVIKGEGYSSELEENIVRIGGKDVPVESATGTELKLTIPEGAESGTVEVIVNDQVAKGPEFKNQTLGILAITPDNGLAGTTVTIDGTGFAKNPSENMVTFNGLPAQVVEASDNKLKVLAPEGLSTGALRLKVGALEAVAPTRFRRAGVMTLAGGPGSTQMDLSSGGGMVMDSQGNLFVTEMKNQRILKVSQDGGVSIFAGSGSYENQDGQGTEAGFGFNSGSIAIDSKDNLYVVTGMAVRKITPAALVSTFATLDNYGYQICADPSDNIYVFKSYYGYTRITPDGQPFPANGSFGNRTGRMAVDGQGNRYQRYGFDDYSLYSINIYDRDSRLVASIGGNSPGLVDGIGNAARFGSVGSFVLGDKGYLYVIDQGNYAVRRVRISNYEVSTLFQGEYGYEDGAFDQAKFATMGDIAVAPDGAIYILESGTGSNNAIRKIFLE